MTETSVIRLETAGHIAEVILDRPEKLNAMAPVFFDQLRDVFEQVDRDDQIRAVILRAEGKHFTAGLDLMAASNTSPSGTRRSSIPRI